MVKKVDGRGAGGVEHGHRGGMVGRETDGTALTLRSPSLATKKLPSHKRCWRAISHIRQAPLKLPHQVAVNGRQDAAASSLYWAKADNARQELFARRVAALPHGAAALAGAARGGGVCWRVALFRRRFGVGVPGKPEENSTSRGARRVNAHGARRCCRHVCSCLIFVSKTGICFIFSYLCGRSKREYLDITAGSFDNWAARKMKTFPDGVDRVGERRMAREHMEWLAGITT
jgi:hypothetical protein